MLLRNQDIAVIKQALKIALEHDDSEQASYSYREVLAKLTREPRLMPVKAHFIDGESPRYDYDDAAEI